MRSAIARPAASSLAELTRRPEDRRAKDVFSEPCEPSRARWAFIDARFVLMVWGMAHTPIGSHGRVRLRSAQSRVCRPVPWAGARGDACCGEGFSRDAGTERAK